MLLFYRNIPRNQEKFFRKNLPCGAINWCLSLRVQNYLSLRTSPQTGVAIPRLEGKCIDNCPTELETLQFLVVIVTWFLSTGGLPRQCAHWLAMTAFFQTPIYRSFSSRSDSSVIISYLISHIFYLLSIHTRRPCRGSGRGGWNQYWVGVMCQISSAYWRMVRSEENFAPEAMFIRHLRPKFRRSP